MFQHSIREKEVAICFGMTDSSGITLINQDHPYPFLIEQEERYHGAFLSNTTYGALYQLFDNIELALDLRGPDLSEQEKYTKKIKILCDRNRQRILDDSLNVHESFAKYLAYIKQGAKLDHFEDNLQQLLRDDLNRFSVMAALVQLLDSPYDYNPIEINFKRETCYTLAKWIMNTGELETLNSKKRFADIKDCLEEDNFWEPVKLITRAMDAINLLQQLDLRKLWLQLSSPPDSKEDQLFFATKFSFALYNFLGEQMGTKGYTHIPVKRSFDISVQVIAIAARISKIAPGLQHHFSWMHIQFQYGNDFVDAMLTPKVQNHIYGFLFDPSLKVVYDQRRNNENDWQLIHNKKEFKAIVSHFDIEMVFVYPAIDEAGKLHCFTMVRYVSDEPRGSYLLLKFEVSDIADMLDYTRFIKKKNLSVILLPFPGGGISDYYAATQSLSRKANIIYWDICGYFMSGSGLLNPFTFLIQTGQHRTQQPGIYNDSIPYLQVSFVHDSIAFSAVPQYYFDILERVKGMNYNNNTLPHADNKLLVKTNDNNAYHSISGKASIPGKKKQQFMGIAEYAFITLYLIDLLPDYLPLYDTLAMHEKLKQYTL